MKFKTIAASLLLLSAVYFLAASVAAQWLPPDLRVDWWNPAGLAQFIFPNMPAEWFRVPEVIWYILIPFIVAVAVIYGILTELRIFRRGNYPRINMFIAFCMAFLLLPSGVLTTIITYFYAGGAFIGLMGFGILFILGVIFWVYGRSRAIFYEMDARAHVLKNLRDDKRSIDDRIRRIDHEITMEYQKTTPNDTKIKNLQGERDTLRDQLHNLAGRIDSLAHD